MSFIVADNISKDSRAFADSDFLKRCMLHVVVIVCPENKKD